MVRNNIKVTHILIHSVYQMMATIVYGFGIYMLLERGYSASVAGICFSLVNLFSLVVTPFISNYLDNTDRITIIDLIIVSSILVVVLYVINYFLDTKSMLLSIVFIIGNGIFVTLDPFINAVSSKMATYGIETSFTTARSAGSISYGIMCALFGYISSKASYLSVIIGGLIFSFVLFILGLIINKQYKEIRNNSPEVKEEKEELISFKEFIANNISFFILIIFLVGIYIGFTATDNLMLLVTENVGGTSKDMGYLLAYKAIFEGLAMMSFPFVLKRIKLEKILYLAAIGFVIKQLIITLAPNVFFLYIGQTFQMMSFSFMIPGMIEFVNRYLKKREIIRGVSMTSLAIGVGSVISSTIGGYIIDIYSVGSMNMFSLLITIISAIGFCITIKAKYRNNTIS